jgi:hypothetical protein
VKPPIRWLDPLLPACSELTRQDAARLAPLTGAREAAADRLAQFVGTDQQGWPGFAVVVQRLSAVAECCFEVAPVDADQAEDDNSPRRAASGCAPQFRWFRSQPGPAWLLPRPCRPRRAIGSSWLRRTAISTGRTRSGGADRPAGACPGVRSDQPGPFPPTTPWPNEEGRLGEGGRRASCGGTGASPWPWFLPRPGRVPRVSSRPQAGPAGTRSAVEARGAGRYPQAAARPHPAPTMRSVLTHR